MKDSIDEANVEYCGRAYWFGISLCLLDDYQPTVPHESAFGVMSDIAEWTLRLEDSDEKREQFKEEAKQQNRVMVKIKEFSIAGISEPVDLYFLGDENKLSLQPWLVMVKERLWRTV